ncbi:MAG: JDVT-CTERM domain-containing protein [Magnetococcus sp. DMHC-6]
MNGNKSSDSEGSVLTYLWRQISGIHLVTLSDITAVTPSFTAPDVGSSGDILEFELTVTDDQGAQSLPTRVSVSINPVITVPISAEAVADNSLVDEGKKVILTADNFLPEDGSLTFLWTKGVTIKGSDTPITLYGDNSSTASFIAPDINGDDTIFTFILTVANSSGETFRDIVAVTVQDNNQAPVAVAETDKSIVDEGMSVSLNGIGSTDADGNALTYQWTQIGGIHTVTLSDPTVENPYFTAPDVDSNGDTLIFELVVTDDQHMSSIADTVQVKVNDTSEPKTDTVVGCTLNPNSDVDPMLPILLVLSIWHLWRGRRARGGAIKS